MQKTIPMPIRHTYYTTGDLAQIFHVSTSTVRSWLQKGYIRAEQKLCNNPTAKHIRWLWQVTPDEVERVWRWQPTVQRISGRDWVPLYGKYGKDEGQVSNNVVNNYKSYSRVHMG